MTALHQHRGQPLVERVAAVGPSRRRELWCSKAACDGVEIAVGEIDDGLPGEDQVHDGGRFLDDANLEPQRELLPEGLLDGGFRVHEERLAIRVVLERPVDDGRRSPVS